MLCSIWSLYKSNFIYKYFFLNFYPNICICQCFLFWSCSLPGFPISAVCAFCSFPRNTCPLLLWCFIVMSLGVLQGCTSCWVLLDTFLSVNDSKEEFPRLLIVKVSVIRIRIRVCFTFLSLIPRSKHIVKAYRFILKKQKLTNFQILLKKKVLCV